MQFSQFGNDERAAELPIERVFRERLSVSRLDDGPVEICIVQKSVQRPAVSFRLARQQRRARTRRLRQELWAALRTHRMRRCARSCADRPRYSVRSLCFARPCGWAELAATRQRGPVFEIVFLAPDGRQHFRRGKFYEELECPAYSIAPDQPSSSRRCRSCVGRKRVRNQLAVEAAGRLKQRAVFGRGEGCA